MKYFGLFVISICLFSCVQTQHHALNLQVPPGLLDHADTAVGVPRTSQLIILLSGNSNIYAYTAGDLKEGKKYTSQQIIDLLKKRSTEKDFMAIIKAAENTAYKNTVDMLDAMKAAGVNRYALVDIAKDEENYLKQIYK